LTFDFVIESLAQSPDIRLRQSANAIAGRCNDEFVPALLGHPKFLNNLGASAASLQFDPFTNSKNVSSAIQKKNALVFV